jgi:hypothetical protein
MSILGPKKSVDDRFMYGTVVAFVTIRSRSTFAHRAFTSGVSSVIFLSASISLLTLGTFTLPTLLLWTLAIRLPLSSTSNQSIGCG